MHFSLDSHFHRKYNRPSFFHIDTNFYNGIIYKNKILNKGGFKWVKQQKRFR
jgi:hypothetical protein